MINLVLFILYFFLSFTYPKNQIDQKPIWISGENGYDIYRIPAIVVTNEGTILAFCEGRKSGQGQKFVNALIEPICQAGFRRFSWPGADSRDIILFSNPASEEKRIRMTVRVSYDEGSSWPVAKSLTDYSSAYSDLAVLADKFIACLYETGGENPYETITFARFNLEWLESYRRDN